MRRSIHRIGWGLALVILAMPLVLSSCGDAGGEAKTLAPVRLIAHFTGTFNPSVDVTIAGPEYVTVTFEVLSLDPDPVSPTSYMDVMVHDINVSWTRTDTGVAVPAPITEHIDFLIPCCGIPSDLQFSFLRAEQKLQIPLLYLDPAESYGYEPSTGLTEIACTMNVHFRGTTLAGDALTAEYHLPVWFSGSGFSSPPTATPTSNPTSPPSTPTPTE